jgi:hypothetical protein
MLCVDEEERSEEVGGAIICSDVALASDCKLACFGFRTCSNSAAKSTMERRQFTDQSGSTQGAKIVLRSRAGTPKIEILRTMPPKEVQMPHDGTRMK